MKGDAIRVHWLPHISHFFKRGSNKSYPVPLREGPHEVRFQVCLGLFNVKEKKGVPGLYAGYTANLFQEALTD